MEALKKTPIKHIPVLSIIIPCYCEEEILPDTIKKMLKLTNRLIQKDKISQKSFILFIDDGSEDKTWQIIENAQKSNTNIRGIKLSRNFGHQSALLSGMLYVHKKCDCLVSIDADLQQDENAIDIFLEKYNLGAEVVFGIRNDRKSDTLFKKSTATFFYFLMKKLGVNIIKNHADYRLLGSNALSSLINFQEKNLFLRGVIPLLGFKTDYVFFDVRERVAGESKYPITKMISLAIDGITSFSTVPLRIISFVGFLIFILSIVMGGYAFFQAVLTDNTVPGWASTVLPIYFIGGIQLLSIGISGEYIGKVYKETKSRPLYIIDKILE